jgi:hypothetical protein
VRKLSRQARDVRDQALARLAAQRGKLNQLSGELDGHDALAPGVQSWSVLPRTQAMSLEVTVICGAILGSGAYGEAARARKDVRDRVEGATTGLPGGRDLCGTCAAEAQE